MKFSIFFAIAAMASIWYAVKVTSSHSETIPATTPVLVPSPSSITPAPNHPPNKLPTAATPTIPGKTPSVTNLPPATSPLALGNKPTTNVLPLPQVSANPNTVLLKPREIRLDATTENILNGLMSAIISQESSGNFSLQHPVSGALGMGQILPSNLPEWTTETFGREVSPEQFLSNRDIQYYVIRQKLLQYYFNAIRASDGDLYLAIRRVGAQWYSGQANLYDSTKPVATGPSVQQYTYDVLGRFQNFYPQNYTLRY
jgi:hypothetical protein